MKALDPISNAEVAFLQAPGLMRSGPVHSATRPLARGKFLYVDDEKLMVRGVTYGAFRPDEHGNEFHDLDKIDFDFAAMAASGFNVVRIPHTTPPRALLDIAQTHGLRVMVGLSAEQYVGFLMDKPFRARPSIERAIREKVRTCVEHPALLCYALGNEIPAPIVRFIGPARVQNYLRWLTDMVREEDPGALVTYVNYPTTEYLDLFFLDLIAMNVYLEDDDDLDAYLARLQNIAGDRPLLLSELGLDSLRNGKEQQARTLDRQIRLAADAGCAGAVIFSWTDEWYRGGEDVDDWAFGLTDRDRTPKPALAAVRDAFTAIESPIPSTPPSISVVLCSYNGSRTISETLDALLELEYPDFEVIVVDDGSTDETASLADRDGVRLLRMEHRGLSSARNTGLTAATGDIVAYIDDDAYPDRDWLSHLSRTFINTTHAGIGGPNISPAGDGYIHQCVSNAPGNPSHVLINDVEAEHIPGCNMAFRREALLAIGGFDTQYWSAGDDVDVCWRLRDAGFTLGFSPAAVVWHHRRGTIRAYLKQQRGYGRAESLLARKWRDQLGGKNRLNWHGTIYGGGHTRPLRMRRPTVYHGVWGQAPFQSVYDSQLGRIASLLLAPQIVLYMMALAVLAIAGVASRPLLWAAVPLALILSAVVTQAVASARRSTFPPHTLERHGRRRLIAITAMLHILQPIARLWGQLRPAPVHRPAGRRAYFGLSWPLPKKLLLWTDDWQPDGHRLMTLETDLMSEGAEVIKGSAVARWDLEIRTGSLGRGRICLASEDHTEGHQLVRVRVWPHVPAITIGILIAMATGSVIAAVDSAWFVAWAFGSAFLGISTLALLQCSSAIRAFSKHLKRIGFARHVSDE
ncbi:MAG: glycosyltransferase [Acidimicrobiia bacterium]|nr:glycosyltransferase [Acidimicrobiia bacterium]NNL28627.1 glycosyltransferase [Acidimicrobiia bacterium]